MLDKAGKEIPQHLEYVFCRNSIQLLLREYNGLAADVLLAIGRKDEMFKGIHKSTFEAICSDIQNILKAEIPYAVCPFCDAEGCKACLGRGWLGKFRYDATASARKD